MTHVMHEHIFLNIIPNVSKQKASLLFEPARFVWVKSVIYVSNICCGNLLVIHDQTQKRVYIILPPWLRFLSTFLWKMMQRLPILSGNSCLEKDKYWDYRMLLWSFKTSCFVFNVLPKSRPVSPAGLHSGCIKINPVVLSGWLWGVFL